MKHPTASQPLPALRATPVIGADEEKTPLAGPPTAYVIALSVVVLFGIAGAAGCVWFVSRDSPRDMQRGSGTSVSRRSEA